MSAEEKEPTVTEEFYAHNKKAEAFGTLADIAESLPKRADYHGLVVLNEYEWARIVNTCRAAAQKP